MIKILGIERDLSACNHLRVLQPLYKMRQLGLADCLTVGERELHTEYAAQKVLESDVVVFQRSNNKAWLDFIRKCQSMGKIIICDYDDDPFETHPLNPHYQVSGIKEYEYTWPNGNVEWLWKNGENGFNIEENIERRDMFRTTFSNADLVTTTTDILADTFRKINPNVAVLPNLVDFNLYDKLPKMEKGKIRIGYQGGMSHYPDLFMILTQIEEVISRNKNVTFVFLGDYRFEAMFNRLPKEQFEFHSWVQHNAYPYKLALLNLDIGLCPLVDDEFNRQKSCIKFLDYTMVGATTIASNIPPYNNVIQDEKDGILSETEGWVGAMESLIKDKEKRIKLHSNAYDKVYEEYNADTKAHLWAEAYEKVAKGDL